MGCLSWGLTANQRQSRPCVLTRHAVLTPALLCFSVTELVSGRQSWPVMTSISTIRLQASLCNTRLITLGGPITQASL